jgi:hypothetical protein
VFNAEEILFDRERLERTSSLSCSVKVSPLLFLAVPLHISLSLPGRLLQSISYSVIVIRTLQFKSGNGGIALGILSMQVGGLTNSNTA